MKRPNNIVPSKIERLQYNKERTPKVMDVLRRMGIETEEILGISENEIFGDLRIVRCVKRPDLIGKTIEYKVQNNRAPDFFCKYESSVRGSYGRSTYPSGIAVSQAHYWLIYKCCDAYLIKIDELRRRFNDSREERNSEQGGRNDSPDKARIVPLYGCRIEALDI